MDTAPISASNADTTGGARPSVGQPPASPPPVSSKNTAKIWITWIFLSVIIGIGFAMVSIWRPANRIVTLFQPYSEYVRFPSVRIAKDGFIVLYVKDFDGLRLVSSTYLAHGYYRNLVVMVDPEDIINRAPAQMQYIARLYVDDGDGVFDQEVDTPVTNRFGKLVSQFFTMDYDVDSRLHLLRSNFFDRPFVYIGDYLFP